MHLKILHLFRAAVIVSGCFAVSPVQAASADAAAIPFGERQLAAGHALVQQKNFAAARLEYSKLLSAEFPPILQSLGQLAVAYAFEAEGSSERAAAAFDRVRAMAGAPGHQREEAAVRAAILRGTAPIEADSRTKPPLLPTPGLILHVAPAGSDTAPGTSERPFATVERARDEIRLLQKRGLPKGGVAVVLHDGEFIMSQTLELSREDSGTDAAPIVYQAARGAHPRFRGGLRLTNAIAVADPAVLSQLPDGSRSKVLALNLAGIQSLLPLQLGGFASGRGFITHPAHELYFNGAALELARWPNDRFIRIKDVAMRDGTKGYDREGSKTGAFLYEGDRPSRWLNEPDLLLYGYWFWDWADSYERVASIDPVKKLITLEKPFHRYGYSINAPFYAVNALTELDAPGEWYLDRTRKAAYFYPPSDPEHATFEISTFPELMLRLDNVSHVQFLGLTWELGSADAIRVRGGEQVHFNQCIVRRFAGHGIQIEGGLNHSLLSCDIHSMGRGGVSISGGSRKDLTPGGHLVENCEIYDLSRIDHTYTPAVIVSGVGHRVAHNRLHDIRSSAMRVGGNDHRIEFNEVFNVVLESDDQGGADMWGNATYRGNVYRHNYWHHIGNWRATGEQPKCGQSGIRLDDAISGTLVFGNIFYRCSAGKIGFGGIQIHGGKDNVIDNNVFAECAAAVSFTPWNDQRWRESVKNALDDSAIDKALYLDRYPELATLMENANRNHVWRNTLVNCGELVRRDPKRSIFLDNIRLSVPADEFKLDPAAPAFNRPGAPRIPVERIGLYTREPR